jgi:hypothetical protein
MTATGIGPRRFPAVLVALLLAVSSAAGGEDLTASKPFDLTPELAKGNQRWPAAAAGKDVHLVVWQEGEPRWGVENTDILAARVSADGKPLDARAIEVCKAKGYQTYPAVVFDGASFLVAWQDFRNGKDWDLYAARVSPDGKVLDPDGFAVAAVPGNQIYPALACDGRQVLAVWSDLRPSPEKPELEVYALWGTFIRDGKPAEAAGHELGRVRSSIVLPVAAWDGSSFLVLAGQGECSWSMNSGYALAVSADGKVQKMDAVHPGTCYSLAADPAGRKALVWADYRTEHGHLCACYPTVLLSEGKRSGGTKVNGLQWAHTPANGLWPAATWNGKNFLAVVEQIPVWQDRGEPESMPPDVSLVATRVDPKTGRPLDCSFSDDPKPWDQRDGKRAPTVAGEKGVNMRHPAMASTGGGKALLVFSRHAGPEKWKIHGVLLSE